MDKSIEELGIANFYLCPLKDFNFTLQGSYNAKSSKILQFEIDYCSQEWLDSKHPKMNKTCRGRNETDAIMS